MRPFSKRDEGAVVPPVDLNQSVENPGLESAIEEYLSDDS